MLLSARIKAYRLKLLNTVVIFLTFSRIWYISSENDRFGLTRFDRRTARNDPVCGIFGGMAPAVHTRGAENRFSGVFFFFGVMIQLHGGL